jgi:zinc protease
LGGGGLTNRLFEEVRKERGLAYSASTFVYALDHAGLLLGSAGTQSARAGETLAVIREVLADVAQNGITQAELDDARDYLTGSFPLRLNTNSKIARTLVAVQMDDLGLDYLDKRNGFYEAVTLDDVNRVAARYLDPDNLLVVVTGRPEGIETTAATVD